MARRIRRIVVGRKMTATRRMVTAMIAVALMVCVSATPASAATETFMGANWGLSHGNAYASFSAHTYVNHIVVNSDHTACPAVGSGYGGYTSTPFSGGHNTAYQSNLCGPYVTEWYPNPTGGSLHGAVFNPNVTTYDVINAAWYAW